MAAKNSPKNLLIVGLGNPGADYCCTPHNAGFTVVDEFARRFEFPEFKMEPDGILVSKKDIGESTIILAKPQMFMNNSGKALAKLFSCLKIRKAKAYPNLWIINDDLDLPLGKMRISQNRGSAGHKGVQSIIDTLKTKNFVRFRVGVASSALAAKKIPADKLVLKKISPKDQIKFDQAIDSAVLALEAAINEGIAKSMSIHNQ